MEFTDPALEAIAAKALAGQALTQADGEALFATRDLHGLGLLADAVRRQRHGDAVYYNVNRHVNYTNICVLRCKFCSFCRRPGEDGAYEMTIEQVADAARQATEAGATEVHVTGGLHPAWMIEHYERMIREIRLAAPRLHVKAFTAVEIAHMARLSRLSVPAVLQRLVEVGLNSLPGGGAEIFDPRVRGEAFAHKMGQDAWFAVHRAAHQLGLPTNATMLYGHVETHAERVGHLLGLRQLQADSGGLQCVVPLSFIPAGSALAELPGPTGQDDLRTMAVVRLMLDNVPHLKTFWVMHGVKLSQLALSYGADDIDGTVVWYDITKDQPRAGTHQEMTVEQLRRVIVEAGYRPVERDSQYRRVIREGGDWRVEQPV